MKNLRAFAMTSTLTLFLAAPAFAADPAGSSANPSATSSSSNTGSASNMSGSTDVTLSSSTGASSAGSNASLPLQKASDLIGKSVINPQRQDLGKVSDIMIDPSTGRVAYMVLSSGGFLGMGGKLFAIPLSAFHPIAGQDKLALNIDKDKLMNAPGFDTSHWPNMANREWGTHVHQYYGVTPYWEGSSGGMGAESSNMSGAAGSAGAGSASSSAAAHPSSQTSSSSGNR